MKYFKNWDEVTRCLATARNNGRMASNFFPDEKRMSRWFDNGSFLFEEYQKTTFLVRRQETFSNIYFLSESSKTLAEDLPAFLANNISMRFVVDVLGVDIVREPLEAVFKSSGFTVLTTLQRMSRRTPDNNYVLDNEIEIAKVSDADSIHRLLINNFVAEEEQIPCLEDILDWIDAGEILIAKDIYSSNTIGFIIFDLSPATLYLRYWFVSPQGRGNGVGGRLMRSMFAIGKSTKRQYFWVKTDNENAIIRYKHYGFEFEQLKDTVLLLSNLN